MKLPIITTFVIALSFLAVTVTEAKIYKWKDAEGVMHYSATPPKPSEKISDLKDNLRLTDNKAKALKTQSESKKKGDINEKKQEHDKKLKKRNYCDGQRRNFALLKKNINVKWIENGKTTKLTAEQRKEKLRSLENSISDNCSYGDEAEDQRKHRQHNDNSDQQKNRIRD